MLIKREAERDRWRLFHSGNSGEKWSNVVIHNGVAYFCGQTGKKLVPDRQFIYL
jgi:enamine deaminase RidA (YjgF/YER057c/UK114 family)